jgi:hypothetical protein
MDKDRKCDKVCKAYNLRNDRCKLIDSAVNTASGFRQILRWAESHDVPRVG